MANKRQIKKNLRTYSQKARGKSKRNIRTATEKPPVPKGLPFPAAITINPCAEINVVEARPYPAAGAYVPPQTLKAM